MDKLTLNYQVKLKQLIQDQLEANARLPKEDAFGHGAQIGEWRGLVRALDALLDLLDEDLEADKQR